MAAEKSLMEVLHELKHKATGNISGGFVLNTLWFYALNHLKLAIISAKMADSAAWSKVAGGVEKLAGLVECSTKLIVTQAVPLTAE